MTDLIALVNEQAEDEGLWFIDATCSEAYLQAALRKLHAAVEARAPAATPKPTEITKEMALAEQNLDTRSPQEAEVARQDD